MPIYVASLKLTLPVPIRALVAPTKPLERRFDYDNVVITARIRPELDGDQIKVFDCEVTYEGRDLGAIGWDAEATKGVALRNAGRPTAHPLEAAAVLTQQVLHNLSALTLQPGIFSRKLLKQLLDLEPELVWQKPDGSRALGMRMTGLMFGRRDILDPSRLVVEHAHWQNTQELLDEKSAGAPLWRVILADAHQEWDWDIRNATLKCAMALDVALQPFISALEQRTKQSRLKPLQVLRGERLAMTPSLEQQNPSLYDNLKKLWYTRHGIIHHGSKGLFEQHPETNPVPVGPLTANDVERFLLAVVPAVKYVEAHPP